MTTLNDTPSANRIHIGFYGKRNSGKSSLINAFVGQDVSIVSDVAGTTTDVVNKAMEIHGIGPCVLIDTAGFDDEGELGKARIEKTKEASQRTDIAVVLFTSEDMTQELLWVKQFKNNGTAVIAVISKADLLGKEDAYKLAQIVEQSANINTVVVSAKNKEGLDRLHESMLRTLPNDYGNDSIIRGLVGEEDVVLLVMPQDIQAPKGRLILPQVQTIRELLDKKCIVISTTTDKMQRALETIKAAPKLIITDSQAFKEVYAMKPKESLLTSFSVLFAAYKGDIDYYTKSASEISKLNDNSRVLIAECCTHAPLAEDIGRVKLPRMLKNRFGEGIDITIVSGTDFPDELTNYDLIIQCGGCMFNRKYVMSRIQKAKDQGVPMTNYGVAIAYTLGILDALAL